MKQERTIVLHGSYFIDFYIKQNAKTQEKIDFVFSVLKKAEWIPEKFLKHLSGTDGLYEVRVRCEGNIFRVFCCFDKGNLVILFNAFQKKSQQIPKQEILFAEKLKNEYFQQKNL